MLKLGGQNKNITHCYFLSPVSFKIKKKKERVEGNSPFGEIQTADTSDIQESVRQPRKQNSMSFYHGEQLCVASSQLCAHREEVKQDGASPGKTY